MLVLRRKVGEAIMIDDDVRIVLVQSDGGAARIGIDAPAGHKVFREELYQRINETQEIEAENDATKNARN